MKAITYILGEGDVVTITESYYGHLEGRLAKVLAREVNELGELRYEVGVAKPNAIPEIHWVSASEVEPFMTRKFLH